MGRDLTTLTAYHEAAHAIVSYRTSGVADAIAIVPNDDTGTVGHALDVTSDSFSDADMAARVVSCYAGAHAQRRLDPASADEGCDGDEEEAHALLVRHGWEHREAELRAEASRLVDAHWREIVAVAAELLEARTLDGTEVEIIADGAAGDPDGGPVALGAYRRLREARPTPERVWKPEP